MDQKPLVLVTGISGFIGAHVCHYFLKHGGFRVRGTMRSIGPDSQAPLRKSIGDLFDQVELMAADLNNEQSIIDACEGCTYVVHVASPVVFGIFDPEELIRPAVDGTLSAMRGAVKHKVKRVVITSSIAAVSNGNTSKMLFKPDDWTDPAECLAERKAYALSKTYSEKAAWDFLKDLPEEDKFELVSVCPALVFGKSLNQRWSAAGGFIDTWKSKGFISNSTKPSVDIKDVAEAHLQSVLKPEAAGKRFLLSESNLQLATIFNIFAEMVPSLNLSKVEEDIDISKIQQYDNTSVSKILGINFIPHTEYVKVMVQDMLDQGVIEKQ